MKKLLILALLTIVALCIFASCGGQKDGHTHDFGEWVTVKEPTTTEVGLKERTCACGEKEIQTIDKRLKFTLNDDAQSYTVTGIGTCTDTDVFIPNTYEGLPVTSIGWYAFSGCTGLTSIVIGDSVTSIGYGAFEDCTGLTSIVIPDGVTSIDDYAFYGCTGLTSIVIPDSVTSIGYNAFYDCTGLTSIVIPNSVTSISYFAFLGCTNIQYATMPTKAIAYIPVDNLKEVVINGGTSIGRSAFWGWTGLTSIVIGDSVTSIGEDAFSRCTGLTSIVIGDSVTSIGDGAFYGCPSLKDVYYTGTEAEWAKKSIYSGNSYLKNATIHYNYVPAN